MINPVYQFQNGIGYWNQYNDTIFRIEKGINYARFFFSKGKYRLPTNNSTELDKFFKVINILESNKYVWIIEFNRPKNNVIIIDKNEGISKLVKGIKDEKSTLPGLINDFDGGGNFAPGSYYKSKEGEYLVGWINAFELKAHVDSETFINSTPKYPEKKNELEQLANNLNENDNPVLMLVKLKE